MQNFVQYNEYVCMYLLQTIQVLHISYMHMLFLV